MPIFWFLIKILENGIRSCACKHFNKSLSIFFGAHVYVIIVYQEKTILR